MTTTQAKEWLKGYLERWTQWLHVLTGPAWPGEVTHRRFLSDRPQCHEAYLKAAQEYVSGLDPAGLAWLYSKPFDPSPGNSLFYSELYQILNILRVMNLPHRARVLEVGCGSGWVTEILTRLGFDVEAVDPSESMIAIARERVNALREHYPLTQPSRVTFHCQPLEDCTLPDNWCDAVLFHESLHHVIDEHRGLAQCQRLLRPGGVLGVCEGAWQPGDREAEQNWEAEMARSGTLENPYTQEYLDDLLTEHGFEQITRYHGINGLFPTSVGHYPIATLAQFPASSSNTLTAVKPGGTGPDTAVPGARSKATIHVLQTDMDSTTRKVQLKVRLTNSGNTTWLHNNAGNGGFVTLALRQGNPGFPAFREAQFRNLLPEPVPPKQTLILVATFQLPDDYEGLPWYVDLVNEHYFWFSSRGTTPAELELPTAGCHSDQPWRKLPGEFLKPSELLEIPRGACTDSR